MSSERIISSWLAFNVHLHRRIIIRPDDAK